MPTDPTTLRAPRSTRAGRATARLRWGPLPYSLRAALLLGALFVIGWLIMPWFASGDALVHLVDPAREAIARTARAELFGYDPRPSGRSPTASLGELEFDGRGELVLPAERIGDGVLLRIETPENGIAYGFVEPGDRRIDLALGEPQSVRGVVGIASGPPLAGVRVQVFGGGSRGVLLAETTSGEDGGFAFDRISDTVRDWTFRAFADGFGVAELEWLSNPAETVRIDLLATAPGRGRLIRETADGPPIGDLEIRMFQIPGLVARTAADGSFEVRHLPPAPTRGYLVVPDLPAGFTYRRAAVVAGETVEVPVVVEHTLRGRIVSGYSGGPVAGVSVHHEHGPQGLESTTTDADGRFELRRVPLGAVSVFAHAMLDRRLLPRSALATRAPTATVMIQASQRLVVLPGQPLEDVELTLW